MKGSLFLNKTYSKDELRGLIEAILFVKGKSLNIQEFCEILEVSSQDLSDLIQELNTNYLDNSSGFQIIPVAGGYQMVTNPHFKDELEELFGKRNEQKISPSALEVLAIIAYKQPLTKDTIDEIRGVSSTRSLNLLLNLKLITINGTAKDLDQSPLYVTTKRFLEIFRIQNIEDLPPVDSLDLTEDLLDNIDSEKDKQNQDENLLTQEESE